MTTAYTLHVAPGAWPGDPAALERAELVRDGFSFWALVAPGLWLFRHRCWIAGLLAFAVVIGLAAALWACGAGPGTIVAAEILLHVLFGLEGASLRRASLARAGRPASAVVIASDLADAEAKGFARWLDVPVAAEPAAVAHPAPPRSALRGPGREPIIGLFPEPGGRR